MKLLPTLFALASLLISSGCSVVMATKQPDAKDLSLFRSGTSRSMLVAEFGMPATSEERDGKTYEIFTFTDGYGTGAKVGRAFFHGAADIVTLGLWELVGTPLEGAYDGNEMAYEVSYDQNNRVHDVIVLKRK